MLNGVVADRYTEGLFLAAEDKAVTEAVDSGLRAVAEAIAGHPDLKLFLEHPVIKPGDKVKALQNIFGESLNDLVVRFIRLLFVRGRSEYLTEVYQRFHVKYEASQGRVTVQVESAMPLSDEQVSGLQQAIAASVHQEVQAEVEVNPDLIAGYRIRMGNRVLDATVKNALAQFGQQLKAAGQQR